MVADRGRTVVQLGTYNRGVAETGNGDDARYGPGRLRQSRTRRSGGCRGQTVVAVRRVGPGGYVLVTDLSSNILEFALQAARREGLGNVETRVIDGENLEELEQESFDAVISRVA